MSKHTPTPWNAEELQSPERGHRISIHNANTGDYVAQVNFAADPQAKANAAHIVRCVNLHDALVDALKGLLEMQFGTPMQYAQARENAHSVLKLAKEA